MRRHFLSLLFLLAAGAIWWASISSTVRNPYVDDDRPLVVTSGYVPYTLTRQLAGDLVNVLMLLPPGAEPHAFEPTPGALISLKHADAFLYISHELEPWAQDLTKAAGNKTYTQELARVVQDSQDPHVWMSFQNTQKLADQIVRVLIQVDPAHQAEYEANLAKLNAELAELDEEYTRVLGHCQHRQVVHVGHLAFAGLAKAYGLTLTALSGTSHEGEHSAKKLAQLTQAIQAQQLPAIFTEETLSPRLAKTVSAETGAQVLPLYPIEHISKQDFNNHVTYGELMRRNLASLARGLVCKAL